MIGSFVISPLQLPMFTPLEIMSRCSEAALNFRIIPAGIKAPTGISNGACRRYPFEKAYTKPQKQALNDPGLRDLIQASDIP